MEKIYMEEEKNNQRKRQRKQSVDFSVVLSFVVAIFAIVSLGAFAIASNQGNNVSYAAPTPDTFNIGYYSMTDQTHHAALAGQKDGAGADFTVPFYFDGPNADANHVFCIQHGKLVENGMAYTKVPEKITDSGLLYILAHTYPGGVSLFNDITDATYKKYADIYATQLAIWLYLNDTSSDPLDKLSTEDLTVIPTVNTLTVLGGTGIDTITIQAPEMYNRVKAVIDAAKVSVKTINITKASDDFVETSDGKYYQSGLITVVGDPSTDLKSFDVKFSGVDGVVAVDENGEQISLEGISPATKFYVRIPKDRVTEKTAKLYMDVNGVFNGVEAYKYTAADVTKQTVIVIENGVETAGRGIEFDLVGAPDTGMNTAQTIYFVGLIILLCGVGIVYANAKPVENKQ